MKGRWLTYEWEGGSQVNGRMRGGSRVSRKVITCDRSLITRGEWTTTCGRLDNHRRSRCQSHVNICALRTITHNQGMITVD